MRKGLGIGKGQGYSNIVSVDRKIHSDSARGIKQPQGSTWILCPKKISQESIFPERESPFSFQDSNQEKIIHARNWNRGTSYRYILEGTGDIFRETTKKNIDNCYINEKISRIENHFKDMEKRREFFPETGVHPDDSFELSERNNKRKFQKMIEFWKKQPVENEIQKIAKDLNISMLTKDYTSAKKQIRYLKQNTIKKES